MKLSTFLLICLLATPVAFAAPGAHGPGGEHLDSAGGHAHSGAGPRIETFTEAFELVGSLQGDELSILIDRYETNEPVLNGKLEVEYKGMKADARFHADHGDYSVNDDRLLKALAQPGAHALIFTLHVGDESDLLEGTLDTAVPSADPQDHAHEWRWTWIAALAAAAAALTAFAMRMRRRKKITRTPQ